MKVGRKPNERRLLYGQKYSLSPRQTRYLRDEDMAQLDACLTDEARRLLLGVSHKQEEAA